VRRTAHADTASHRGADRRSDSRTVVVIAAGRCAAGAERLTIAMCLRASVEAEPL
jgi:hypothetical protein